MSSLHSRYSGQSEESMSVSSECSTSQSRQTSVDGDAAQTKGSQHSSVNTSTTSPSRMFNLGQLDTSESMQIPKAFFEQLIEELQATKRDNRDYKERIQQLQQLENVTLSSGSGKAHLTRTKSEPGKGDQDSFYHPEIRRVSDPEVRKDSDPEIFIFPDCRTFTSKSDNDSVNSDAIDARGRKESDIRSEADGADNVEYDELSSLKASNPGVSHVYFMNAINELAKTKKHLRSLEIQQKMEAKDKLELEKLRQHHPKLQFAIQKLQNELKSSRNEVANLRASRETRVEQNDMANQKVVKEESFELETKTTVQSQNTSRPLQIDNKNYHEVQRMKFRIDELSKQNMELRMELDAQHYGERRSQIEALGKERDELKSELVDLNKEYDILKNSVKILSTCLHEEKGRNRKVDEQLKKSKTETKKLVEQMGILRYRYEELSQEKTALEKAQSLNDDTDRYRPFHHGNSHSNGRNMSRAHSNPDRPPPIALRPPSQAQGPNNSTLALNIDPSGSKLNWNNLSTENEVKKSNLTRTAPYQCFRCLQNFHVENTYMMHLNKCID